MSMSDCPKCWDTPCTCGWDWRSWNPSYLRKIASGMLAAANYLELYPNSVFSGATGKDTADDKKYIKYMTDIWRQHENR